MGMFRILAALSIFLVVRMLLGVSWDGVVWRVLKAHFLIFPDCWAESLLDVTDAVLWVSRQNGMPC